MKIQLDFIQILRGFAAVAVLIYHLDAATLLYFNHSYFNFEYGYLGVDFFFALSGFIITYTHLKDIEQRGSVRKFILKRFIRIYPLYWITLILVVVVTAPDFTDKPDLRTAFTPFTLEGWGVILRNALLLPIKGEYMPVGVAWTLIYEMVFYSVFAVCIMSGWKVARYILAGWLLFILINSRDLFPKSVLTEVVGGNLIVEFIAGCVVGYLFVKGKEFKGFWLVMGLTVIAGLFALYLSWHDFNRHSIAMTTLMGATSALIIFYAATLDKNRKYRTLASPLLRLIGDASYSIYITHCLYLYFICGFTASILDISSMSIVAKDTIIVFIFLLSIIIGVLIHVLIEKPLLTFFRGRFSLQKSRTSVAV